MVSEKRAKTCIYCELDKICYERLQNIQETLLHSFFRNSSKSHEFEKRWKKCQNSWRFCAKSFFSLVRQNFSSHLRRCLMKQTNLPHPNKTQKLDKYVYKVQRFCDYNITYTIFVVSAIRYPCNPEYLVEHHNHVTNGSLAESH